WECPMNAGFYRLPGIVAHHRRVGAIPDQVVALRYDRAAAVATGTAIAGGRVVGDDAVLQKQAGSLRATRDSGSQPAGIGGDGAAADGQRPRGVEDPASNSR